MSEVTTSHGEWIPRVESHLTFGNRQARRYMRIYEIRTRVSDLDMPMREAVALLAEPKEQPGDDGSDISPGLHSFMSSRSTG